MTVELRAREPRLSFFAPSHTYSIDGSSKGIISMTTLVHTMFPEFDADVAIRKMRHGRNWSPQHPCYAMSDGEIKAAWEKNRVQAAGLGTAMHAHLEAVFNAQIAGAPPLPHPQPDAASGLELLREEHLRAFLADHAATLRPWRMELMIFDEELRLAGMVDALFTRADCADGDDPMRHIVLMDWKRTKELKRSNPWEKGIAGTPAEDMDDCNFNHFCIQLNGYKYVLERRYGVHVDEMFIVVFHPNQASYMKVPIEPMPAKIAAVMERRLRAVRAGVQTLVTDFMAHAEKE